MLKKLKTNSSGFTIIEVMIVLAIAGLILVIVLLAVPALKRNSYNTTIKNDVSSLSGGVSDFESNNNGTPATTIAYGTPTVISGASGTTTNVTLSGTVTAVTSKTTTGGSSLAGLATPPTGTIYYYAGYQCDGTAAKTNVGFVYSIETSSSGNTPECADS